MNTYKAITLARAHARLCDAAESCAPEVDGGYLDLALKRMRLATKHGVRVHYGMAKWIIECRPDPRLPYSPHSLGASGCWYFRFFNPQAAAQAYSNILESLSASPILPVVTSDPDAATATGAAPESSAPVAPSSSREAL